MKLDQHHHTPERASNRFALRCVVFLLARVDVSMGLRGIVIKGGLYPRTHRPSFRAQGEVLR